MIKLEGTIINVFTQQGGKDKKTGEAFADREKIQHGVQGGLTR